MKNYFLLLLTIFALSCSSDEAYEDLNKNPNAPAEVSDNQLFVSATNSLTDFIESTNVNVNNFMLGLHLRDIYPSIKHPGMTTNACAYLINITFLTKK